MTTRIDPQELHDVLGNYPTGVCVITATAADDGQALAMVVGTFASVSKDPPLVSFMPTKASTSFAQLRDAGRFVVNIVAHDQAPLVRRLARSDRSKMDDESWRASPVSGAPMLDGVVAAIECDTHSVLDAGDHFIVLGTVTGLQTVRPTIPLLYFRGGYGEFAPTSFVATEGRGLSGALAGAQELRGQIEHAAREFGGEVTVFGRIAGESVALATAPAPGGDQITRLGARYPVAPPIGALYLAWSTDEEQRAWLDRAVSATPAERAGYRRQLDDARAHGWSVSVLSDDDDDGADDESAADPDEAVRRRHAEMTRHLKASSHVPSVDRLDPLAWYRVAGLMAPVPPHAGGAPDLMIRVLMRPSRMMTGREVRAAGETLRAFSQDAALRVHGPLATAP